MLSPSLWCYIFREKVDDAARGVRLSGDDEFIVFAMNIAERIVLAFYPYKPSDQCFIPYPFKNVYVYSLTSISNHDKKWAPGILKFAYVAEDIATENVLLTIITTNKSNCGMFYERWF